MEIIQCGRVLSSVACTATRSEDQRWTLDRKQIRCRERLLRAGRLEADRPVQLPRDPAPSLLPTDPRGRARVAMHMKGRERPLMSKTLTWIALLALSLGGSIFSAEVLTRPIATVEGKREGKLIFVPLRVNGKGPFWFCVDTGASHTVLDPGLARELHLKIIESSATTGTGQGDVPVDHVGAITIASGSFELKVADPWVIDLSQVPIPKWTRGLVGAEFFEAYVVELNPERASLQFYDPATYRKRPNATSIPLTLENHDSSSRRRSRSLIRRSSSIDSGSIPDPKTPLRMRS